MKIRTRLVIGILATGATVAGLLLSADAAGAAVKSSITIKTSKSTLMTGTPEFFTGVARPHATPRTVELQRSSHGKWTTVDTRRTKKDGTYRFRWIIAAVGRSTFRTVVVKNSHAAGASSKKVSVTALKWHSLPSLAPVTECYICFTGAVDINGKHFDRGLYGDEGFQDSDYVEYNLKRSCRTFSGTLGLRDDSSDNAGSTMSVSADGHTLYSAHFGLGESTKVTRSIVGNLRIKLRWTYAGDDPHPAYGNPRILCSW